MIPSGDLLLLTIESLFTPIQSLKRSLRQHILGVFIKSEVVELNKDPALRLTKRWVDTSKDECPSIRSPDVRIVLTGSNPRITDWNITRM